jgi:hypothetical protein
LFQFVDQRCGPASEAYEKTFGMAVAFNLISEVLERFEHRLVGGVLIFGAHDSSVNDTSMNADHDSHEIILQHWKTKSRREDPGLSEEKQECVAFVVISEDREGIVAVQIAHHNAQWFDLHTS